MNLTRSVVNLSTVFVDPHQIYAKLENHEREYIFDDRLPNYNTERKIVRNKLSNCPQNFKIPNFKLFPKSYPLSVLCSFLLF